MANRGRIVVAALLALGMLSANAQDTRTHQVKEGFVGQPADTVTEYRLPELGASAQLSRTAAAARYKPSQQNGDFEIAAVDISLSGDYDGDGYFHVIELDWDADTVFSSADVYGVVWLSYEGGPWEEFLTSATYTINGSSSADRYRVESDLRSGYPTGTYDLLLELYDPDSGELLASLGPSDTLTLAQLPLEDRSWDEDDDHYHGGGALGAWTMLLLGLILMARCRFWARRE